MKQPPHGRSFHTALSDENESQELIFSGKQNKVECFHYSGAEQEDPEVKRLRMTHEMK